MSKFTSCPTQVRELILQLGDERVSVWARDNFCATLEAIRDESTRAIKSFEKQKIKASAQRARKMR